MFLTVLFLNLSLKSVINEKFDVFVVVVVFTFYKRDNIKADLRKLNFKYGTN